MAMNLNTFIQRVWYTTYICTEAETRGSAASRFINHKFLKPIIRATQYTASETNIVVKNHVKIKLV